MPKEIEIPFGAKDSELIHYEWTIPQGYNAEIKNGKIVIDKSIISKEKIESMADSYKENLMKQGVYEQYADYQAEGFYIGACTILKELKYTIKYD